MWLAASYAQSGDVGKAGNQEERLSETIPDFTLSEFPNFFKVSLDYEHLRQGIAKACFSQ